MPTAGLGAPQRPPAPLTPRWRPSWPAGWKVAASAILSLVELKQLQRTLEPPAARVQRLGFRNRRVTQV